MEIYAGSDGTATLDLYKRLEALGPRGEIAMQLFRAQKASARAKVYRGGDGTGSYRSKAYGRKHWAIAELCVLLTKHGKSEGIEWGWSIDEEAPAHRHVLYVELPNGQVSFHMHGRIMGPDAPKPFDGCRGASHTRVVRFCADVLDNAPAPLLEASQ